MFVLSITKAQRSILCSQTCSLRLILSKMYAKILFKFETVFQNYQNFSDVIAEKPKQPSENREPIKSEQLKLSDCCSAVTS